MGRLIGLSVFLAKFKFSRYQAEAGARIAAKALSICGHHSDNRKHLRGTPNGKATASEKM
eukprot:4062107-Amphidinium_carterae.1